MLLKVCNSFTRLEIMVMWLNVPRPPCFKGMVTKNVVQSLENTGSSFWKKKNQHMNNYSFQMLPHSHAAMKNSTSYVHVFFSRSPKSVPYPIQSTSKPSASETETTEC